MVERSKGSAATFHGRDVPEPAARAVWVHDVDRAALVLGSSQRDDVVDVEAARRAGVEVVRRRSGGGAVLLIPGDVVWLDVIVPAGDPLWEPDVGRSMWWLGDMWGALLGGATEVHRGPLLANAWSTLVCFAGLGAGEVSRAGRKLVGISQRRTRSAARFQCAVHRHFDPVAVASLFAIADHERAALAALLDVSVACDESVDADRFVEALIARTA